MIAGGRNKFSWLKHYRPKNGRTVLMASYLLHGLWVQHSGLHLWIEQVDGHRVVLPDTVPEGTFPAAVEALLQRTTFRHRLRATLRTPKGREVALTIPTAAYTPEQAVEFLGQLTVLGEDNPAIKKAQRESIAPDLLWLIRMYAGLNRFVHAGRVTIKLAYIDDQWWPQFQLAPGLPERSWVAQMVAAAPGILTINNRNLGEDISETLPHWIAVRTLEDVRDTSRSSHWHPFVSALLHSEPLKRKVTGLLNRLNDWKNSITATDLELVIMVEAPDNDDDNPVDPRDALWPVRVRYRTGGSAPRPVDASILDWSSRQTLETALHKAVKIAPLLDASVNGQSKLYKVQFQGNPIAHLIGEDVAGDWDVYLSTDEIVQFVSQDAPRLKKAGISVLLPKSWATAETTAALHAATDSDPAESPTVSKVGLDTLVEYDWSVSVDGTRLTPAEMQALIESKSGLIKVRGNWVMADTQAVSHITAYMEKLKKTSRKRWREKLAGMAAEVERLKAVDDPAWQELAQELEQQREKFNSDATGGQVTVEDLRALALETVALTPVEFTGSTWYASLLGGAEPPAPSRVELPDTVHASLREYQRRGVDWLYAMSRAGLGAVLADDMGLGKTLQLLTMLAVEHARGEKDGPTLVVVPTSVVGNWKREATKFVPDFKVLMHHGSGRLSGKEFVEATAEYDVVITSYGVVARDFATLSKVDWDHVVLDEAQHIKNSATRSSKAVRSIPARHRIALTGTPMENKLSEMRSILDFTNPGVLGSASFFRNRFAKPIEVGGDEHAMETLRRLTAPFILRRVKTDPTIISDLPEKTEEVLTVSMTPEQAALYQAYVDNIQEQLERREGMARRGLVLASLTRIKQICNHPAHFLADGSSITQRGRHRSGKVAELVRLLDDAVNNGERMLIFTQYKAFGDMLQPYLEERFSTEIPFLHGGVSQKTRDAMVERFQSPDGPLAMILSLKAGGTGLNLTAANVVVHMDRWWNPAVENQATDRAFRIGQDKDVRVYKMMTKGTMEESIQDILDGKTQLAGTVVGVGEGWITELNPDQLAQLMSYREEE